FRKKVGSGIHPPLSGLLYLKFEFDKQVKVFVYVAGGILVGFGLMVLVVEINELVGRNFSFVYPEKDDRFFLSFSFLFLTDRRQRTTNKDNDENCSQHAG